MIPYILHVTVITTVCFLFYKLLLQKETFYRLNRWTLLSCLAVSFLLPLVPVPRDWSWRDNWAATADQPVAPPVAEKAEPVKTEVTIDEPGRAVAKVILPFRQEPAHPKRRLSKPIVAAKPVVAAGPVTKSTPNVVNNASAMETSQPAVVTEKKPAVVAAVKARPAIVAGTPENKLAAAAVIGMGLKALFFCYLLGVLVFGGNFLLQMTVLLYQSYARPVIRDGRFRIVEISGNRAPCSFGNTIFIDPTLYDWETYNQILIHEKVHVSGRHTLDILLAEIALVLQWFNPFVWLYRREVENNLEFLTDASVLEHREVERSAYQLSLLRVSAPHLPFSITNNYNQSLLKRRIVMMNSKRSSSNTVWKYFFLIPLLTGLVCALNKPAAYGAGTTNVSSGNNFGGGSAAGKAVPVSPLKPPALWVTAAAAFADTGGKRKPAASDSGRWWNKDPQPVAGDAPIANGSYGGGGSYGYGDSYGYASVSIQGAPNVQVAPKANVNEQMATTTLAQMDMATQAKVQVQNNVAVQAYTNVSVDVRSEDFRNENDTDVLDGSWFATSSATSADGKINFEMKRESGFSSWSNSLWVDKSEFNPFPGQGSVEFKLVREAGTVTFKGQFDGQEGFGHFHFTPDEAYFAAVKQLGIEEIDGRRMSFFNVNLKKEYISMILHTFPHVGMHELIGLAANHVDQEFIKYWQGSGIDDLDNPRNFIVLKSQHIDRAYMDELKAAGYDHLQLRDLSQLKSQHIDGAYIRELKAAGYDHLTVRDLVSLKAQHVDGGYIRSLGNGSDAIPVRELVSYKAMHIDSSYISSLRSVGYSGLSRNEITSLYSQHITAEFIKGFKDIGYTDLSVRDLAGLKSMGITPDYVKTFRDAGYKDIDLRQLHSFKAQNVTPEFIKGWRTLGYEDLNANQLASLKAMNITPEFVKEFNNIGFDHIPVNLLTSLKATGINADYVSKMKEKGFVSKDLGKYIRLKNDFN